MSEAPRQQPKNLHEFDEEGLASLGLRLERWDILRDTSIPFELKKSNLITGLKSEIAMLEERERTGADVAVEIESLLFDLDDVEALENNEEAMEHIYKEKTAYYAEMRSNYIKQIE